MLLQDTQKSPAFSNIRKRIPSLSHKSRQYFEHLSVPNIVGNLLQNTAKLCTRLINSKSEAFSQALALRIITPKNKNKTEKSI